MPDILIIGGGLTGLAAAWELESLGADYALIEVKPRLGGSIRTERRDGFVLDGADFVLEKYEPWPFLEPLGLGDALLTIGRYRDGELVVFRDGTQMLTDALAAHIRHPLYLRMAASSVGAIPTRRGGQRYGVCLENGLLLDARALIVAIPARWAEHLLRSLSAAAADALLGYQYEPTARISLAYLREAVADLPQEAVDQVVQANASLRFVQTFLLPERVPPGKALLRAGVRASNAIELDALARYAVERMQQLTGVPPLFTWAYLWPEADPRSRALPEHAAHMDVLDAALPPLVLVVGSDYRATRLPDRVAQGRAAARRIWAALHR